MEGIPDSAEKVRYSNELAADHERLLVFNE